jgi:hypothetical protein
MKQPSRSDNAAVRRINGWWPIAGSQSTAVANNAPTLIHAPRDAPEPDSHCKEHITTALSAGTGFGNTKSVKAGPVKAGGRIAGTDDHTAQDAVPAHAVKPKAGIFRDTMTADSLQRAAVGEAAVREQGSKLRRCQPSPTPECCNPQSDD